MSAPVLPEGFTGWVEFWPSRNWIRTEPSKNYGITTMRGVFYLKGPKGAIQFMIGTEWGVQSVRDHLAKFPMRDRDSYQKPTGWDLGYHSHEPMYEGQDKMGDDCDVTGGVCYYDGSGLNADAMVEGFMAGGTEWLWPKLVEVYRNRFEDGPWPSFEPEHAPHPSEAQP